MIGEIRQRKSYSLSVRTTFKRKVNCDILRTRQQHPNFTNYDFPNFHFEAFSAVQVTGYKLVKLLFSTNATASGKKSFAFIITSVRLLFYIQQDEKHKTNK